MTDVRSQDDRGIDEALEETFPASDARANTVETGIRIGGVEIASRGRVTDNRVAGLGSPRFPFRCSAFPTTIRSRPACTSIRSAAL